MDRILEGNMNLNPDLFRGFTWIFMQDINWNPNGDKLFDSILQK